MNSSENKKPIFPRNQPPPAAHYSPGILAGNTLFISGQIGADISGELISNNVARQTAKAMDNMGTVLKAAEMDYNHVVKVTILLANINDFQVR
jgi:2-iminobutanoate/2-iminopropanoate deaminase